MRDMAMTARSSLTMPLPMSSRRRPLRAGTTCIKGGPRGLAVGDAGGGQRQTRAGLQAGVLDACPCFPGASPASRCGKCKTCKRTVAMRREYGSAPKRGQQARKPGPASVCTSLRLSFCKGAGRGG